MKQIKFFLLATLLLTAPFVFISCDDEEDTKEPIIELNAPVEGAVLKIGSKIHFDANFKGYNKLATYRVNIHNNFDGHGDHKGNQTKSETPEIEDFAFSRTWNDIAGYMNIPIHHHLIEIPANATPGKYHLMVFCADTLGNSSMVVRNIELAYDGDDGSHD